MALPDHELVGGASNRCAAGCCILQRRRFRTASAFPIFGNYLLLATRPRHIVRVVNGTGKECQIMTRHNFMPFVLMAVAPAVLPAAALADQPAAVTIDCPGTGGTAVTGLNDAGQVVGWTGDVAEALGFMRDRNSPACETLRFPDAVATLPTGVNDRGQVVGFFVDASGVQYGFIHYRGQWTPIAFPGACETVAIGINNRGQVVGYFDLPDALGECDGPDQAFLREPGGAITALTNPGFADSWQANGINARGDIAGAYNASTGGPTLENGFLIEKSGAVVEITAAGYNEAFPTSISAAGDIVGILFPTFQEFPLGPGCRGFFRGRDGALEVLGNVSAAGSTCTFGINAAGEISGTYFDSAGVMHGFIAPREALMP
jgi:probable HAF family extracellular repeat protein